MTRLGSEGIQALDLEMTKATDDDVKYPYDTPPVKPFQVDELQPKANSSPSGWRKQI